jgi:hypothetical protein
MEIMREVFPRAEVRTDSKLQYWSNMRLFEAKHVQKDLNKNLDLK